MKFFLLPVFFFICFISPAQDLKSPSEFLGYELGTSFTRHHRVVDYFEYLAEESPDRMQLQSYGSTYEGRPLLLATLSSATNMGELENIRMEHLASTRGEGTASRAIVWLSYNVHGNESVSTEASMQTAYELLTKKSSYLENTVVIIDPCINPDGRDRYVNWYKQFRNHPYQPDPNSKEHHEGWWNGRSNHYMFDLNRDWAWLTQVESQQRLRKYNEWLPHVHVDFHEQGVDNPYYFAPAAEPYHEVVSDFQREFQVTLGKNHAKYFDEQGWFYFTKEVFDLFYPSYGDTYPTYNGSIGMTYEQGGSGRAGLGIITSIGDTLTLKDRIAHHHTTGLSTVEVAAANAERLNEEFRKFYRKQDFKYKSYVLQGGKDQLDALSELLDAHQIKHGTTANGTVKGYDYLSGRNQSVRPGEHNLVVSTNQSRGTLVKVLFEPNARLSDSLTYDITAWSLPYAYGLKATASEQLVNATPYSRDLATTNSLDPQAYAYLSDWKSMADARFLSALLKEGIRVRRTEQAFRLEGREYEAGSLIITRGDNQTVQGFSETLTSLANKFKKQLQPASTGFVERGYDFGSSSVQMIRPPAVALLGGEPTNTLRFGEIWHFFEQQLQYPLTVLHSDYWENVNLAEYDILVLPDGYGYDSFLKDESLKRIKDWVSNGGRLIAMGDAISPFAADDALQIKARSTEKDSTVTRLRPHKLNAREAIKEEITGAIFKTKVDNSHPLGFGYGDNYFTLKLGDARYEYLEEGTVVYQETDITPVAGFAGSEAQKNRENTLVFGMESHGNGSVVYMVDNPLFRGFWENGKLFFANALFMIQ